MTFLAGWDQMLPELFLKENIFRSIFGVWQEYRGLGLYDGQSHAAELLHTFYIGLLSLVVPQEYIRWIIMGSLWILGGIGMYVLLNKKIIGAFFYLFNIATIQMFYTPFEAFAFHFAALPWIAWAIQKKSLPFVALLFLLITPQFFIPTLLLPTLILIVCLSGKRLIPILGTFVCINAFWLLPFLYGIPKTAPVIMNAKINQMSSGEDLVRNRAFASPKDVLLLKGFSLDFEDYDKNGSPMFLMSGWKIFLAHPLIVSIQIILAILAGIGIVCAFKKSNRSFLPYVFLFSLCFFLLSSDIIQHSVPILGEALRFPYTKFALLFAFSYSVLLTLGLETLTKDPVLKFLAVVAILVQAFPVFTGYFVSPNLQISFPHDYASLYAYMQTQNKNARIMVLPQSSYWSWKYYQFGYRGSGFLWFGLPQPILDRAFDPWSATNENYYWELSRAIYSKDKTAVDAVIRKYDISYILLDEYVTTPNNTRSLFIDEIKELFGPPTKTFGKLSVWVRTPTTNNFISLKQNLPTVNPYSWTDNDVAYSQIGDYISGEGGITYPYRSLFTKRSVTERDFDVNSLLAASTPVYDSTASADLSATAVKECGLLKDGTADASVVNGALEFRSTNQRGCLSFDIPTLSHKFGYLVTVENKHISGRPLMLSFINDTAKHVELETYLDGKTDYFILPPLAPDGLGYTVYISNDSIGKHETVNTISRIQVSQIPYNELVTAHTGEIASPAQRDRNDIQVDHPNPSFYKIITHEAGTLILSQSFDKGWIAVSNGKLLPHVMINNWSNGWLLASPEIHTNKPINKYSNNQIIYLIFWPQILEFLGFALLPFGMWYIIRKV